MNSQNLLGLYAGALTLAVCASLLMGARPSPHAKFDTIDVNRINIREPDGTLRMVISDRERFPGLIIKGKETPHPRAMAGMLFFNDEGTENGGLIFNGRKDQKGTVSSGLSLTFDRYQQDQQLQLLGLDEGGRHFAGMTINDVADGTTREIMSAADKEAANANIPAITKRLYVGKTAGQSSALLLADAKGQPRLMLLVTPEGEASIQFMDENGKAVRTLSANDLAGTKP